MNQLYECVNSCDDNPLSPRSCRKLCRSHDILTSLKLSVRHTHEKNKRKSSSNSQIEWPRFTAFGEDFELWHSLGFEATSWTDNWGDHLFDSYFVDVQVRQMGKISLGSVLVGVQTYIKKALFIIIQRFP